MDSLVPIIDYERDLSLYSNPWTSHRRHLWTDPFAEVARMSVLLDRLQKEVRLAREVTKKPNSFEVNFDILGYKPEEISISIRDDKFLVISGDHEEKYDEDGNHRYRQQFTRMITLPDDVDREKMRSYICSDMRTLFLEAPLKKVDNGNKKEVPIPIELKKK